MTSAPHSTRFNRNGHEAPKTPFRVGRCGFEHPRELRLPMDRLPLMTSRPTEWPGCAPRSARSERMRYLPSGLQIPQVDEA